MAERTKIWIADTMRELMKKKSIDRIRITEICAEAGIDRSTFYYYFRDKYDLVAWIFVRAAEGVNVIDVKEAAASIQGMKEDILFYRRAYEDTSQNALLQYMMEYFEEKYTQVAKEKLHTETLDPKLQFSIRLYCCGAVGMSRQWILKEEHTSAETVIRWMFDSMPEALRRIYFTDNSAPSAASALEEAGS